MAWNSDSVCRNDNGSCICIFIEERNQYLRTENIVRFCSRGYGGGIGVVASDSVHGDVRKSRKAGIYTRSSRVHGRYFFSAFSGSCDTTSACKRVQTGRAEDLIEGVFHAGTCGYFA